MLPRSHVNDWAVYDALAPASVRETAPGAASHGAAEAAVTRHVAALLLGGAAASGTVSRDSAAGVVGALCQLAARGDVRVARAAAGAVAALARTAAAREAVMQAAPVLGGVADAAWCDR